MPVRISGVLLPGNKRIEYALPYLFGIGLSLSQKILKEANIDPGKKTDTLSEQEVGAIRSIIEKRHRIEGDLRREVMTNVKRLKDINAYRGTRHLRGLPVHGQRTRTNSRTVRGNVRRTMGSGRKASSEKT
jgi:small subunit ribosomal protein S13